jgi:hypothetical protein
LPSSVAWEYRIVVLYRRHITAPYRVDGYAGIRRTRTERVTKVVKVQILDPGFSARCIESGLDVRDVVAGPFGKTNPSASLFVIAMLKILESRDNSRLTDAIDRGADDRQFASGCWIVELRRSTLNLSIWNGLMSISRFAPKNRLIDFRRPSSLFQLRRFAFAQLRNTVSTKSFSVALARPPYSF